MKRLRDCKCDAHLSPKDGNVKANFGYKDGSGEFFITVDTDKCMSCGDCVLAYPANRKTIKYDCGACKPPTGARHLACLTACKPGAITHSW